ncbi:hypothetical protein [Chengkuizengella sediminis]|uniref:hypothetical protein n=1 Tax=Chengkuizengella sediminis TaxID=1885917 RepID=UPI001389AEFB|nr:hypothetical protein [Chengkuizengella sediminis]NDI37241.1 hypothetical protein [Chengkuizengella sediminis]
MNELINDAVSIYLPILGIILVLIRTITSVINKTVAEIILTPINKRVWDNFIDILFISCIIIGFIHIINYNIDSPIFKTIDKIITPITVFTILISILILVVVFIISIFSTLHFRLRKITNIILAINGISVLVFTVLIGMNTKNEYLTTNFYDNSNAKIFLYFIAWFIIYLTLLYTYISIFRYFNKINPKVYQILKISDDEIEKTLAELHFVYTIDHERHILKEYPHSNRTKNYFPFYVYYPKDNRLIKYMEANSK